VKVLVAISDPQRESGLLETAAALAGDGEVVLASAIELSPKRARDAARSMH